MDFTRPPKTATSLPANLIGRWQRTLPNGRVETVEFGSDGFYYAVSEFALVTFGSNDTTMTWGPESYTRIYGNGPTVVGVWQEQSTGADYYFRDNGSFTYSEPGEIDLFGTYEVQSNQMRTAEARAIVAVDGSDLVFDVIFGGTYRYPYLLQGDTLTIDGSIILTRVPQQTTLIYKIFRDAEWAQLRQNGSTKGAPIDISDGYIHFSTAEQAAETAAKHFAGEDNLFLIAVNSIHLASALIWEPSRGGALFPHLYRELRLGDVHWARPLPIVDGVHVFPAGAGFDESAS